MRPHADKGRPGATAVAERAQRKRLGRRTFRLATIAGFVSVAVLWAAVGGGATAVAFDHAWNLDSCTGVPAGAHGLWDDTPGAGANNESALLWARNAAAGNEWCTWSAFVGVSSATYRLMEVRAATNDSTLLTVRLISHAGAVAATITMWGAAAHSGFLVLTADIAPHAISLVRVTVGDTPSMPVGSARSASLLDRIRILNPDTGEVGWEENFSRAG